MTKYFFLLLFLFVSYAQITAQTSHDKDTVIAFLDWGMKKSTKEKATYKVKCIKNEDETWKTWTFHIRDSFLLVEATYQTSKLERRVDSCTYYNPNGSVWHAGRYSEGKKTGRWTYYFGTGELDGTGEYKNGLLTGIWKWYHRNGQQSSEEIYENDSLVSIKGWEEDGSVTRGKIFADKKAEYPGGQEALLAWLNENIEYPGQAVEAGIQGRVFVQFKVLIDGSIEDVQSIGKSPHWSLTKEAVNTVKAMSVRWSPGISHNRKIVTYFKLPIMFRLNTGKQSRKERRKARREGKR